MSSMVNAVQVGDTIVVTNEWGSVIRQIKGLLISFSNGKLTYKSGSCVVTTYL